MNPATIATMIHRWWMTDGSAQVAAIASAVPATPAYTALRAVVGLFIQCSAKMNRAEATRYPNWLTPYVMLGPGRRACRRS